MVIQRYLPRFEVSLTVRLPYRHVLIVASLVVISCVATLIVAIAGSALVDHARYRAVATPAYGG